MRAPDVPFADVPCGCSLPMCLADVLCALCFVLCVLCVMWYVSVLQVYRDMQHICIMNERGIKRHAAGADK